MCEKNFKSVNIWQSARARLSRALCAPGQQTAGRGRRTHEYSWRRRSGCRMIASWCVSSCAAMDWRASSPSRRMHIIPTRATYSAVSTQTHGRPHAGTNGVSWPPEKMDEKLKSENVQKSSFLYLCYILRAIRAGRCSERRYADHIFIQIYFTMQWMHHFVVKFSKFSSPQAARGHWPP